MKKRFHKPILIVLVLVFVGICLLINSSIAMAEDNVLAEVGETSDFGLSRGETLIASLTIFVLAIFVGFEVITKVPPTLHTPLMSGSNAISGIALVGAVLVAGGSDNGFAATLGMLAVALAAINVVGGFMVTDRMLAMFQKKAGAKGQGSGARRQGRGDSG
jgi:NAD(P) transhydrogenase subunit alpha